MNVKVFIDFLKKYKQQIKILLGIYLVAYYTIFRFGYNYYDDVGRVYEGYHGFLAWSRWFTEALSTIVHADWYLADISPLPQLIACLVMAISGAILIELFSGGDNMVSNIIAAALPGITPYFLGIISYKYDAPYMAFALLFTLVPFLFMDEKRVKYIVISTISITMMCISYQATSGVYCVVVWMLVLRNINNGENVKEQIRFIIDSIIGYVVGILIFWLFIYEPNGINVDYSPLFMIKNVFFTWINYYKMLLDDFKWYWSLLIIVMTILFVIAFIQDAKINKFLSAIIGVINVVVASALCFGAYLLIDREALDVRSMYAFGVVISIMALSLSKYKYYRLVYFALAWCFFGFSFQYGNMVDLQRRYADYRMDLVIQDLNSLDYFDKNESRKLSLIGDIGYSPAVVNAAEGYDMIPRLMQSGFGEDIWDSYYLYKYLNIPNTGKFDSEKDTKGEVVLENIYETIYSDEENIVVELHKFDDIEVWR